MKKIPLIGLIGLLVLSLSAQEMADTAPYIVTLTIDEIIANDIQEDRISDAIDRGDEIYLIYGLTEITDTDTDDEELNASIRVWGPISDVFDADTFDESYFEFKFRQIEANRARNSG